MEDVGKLEGIGPFEGACEVAELDVGEVTEDVGEGVKYVTEEVEEVEYVTEDVGEEVEYVTEAVGELSVEGE